jgi:LDH2 family malate/lactate/ureidoglycolate dehydrogenase
MFFILAIDAAITRPLQSFQDQLTRLVDEIKSSRKQPGVEDIRIPFERAQRERNRRREEGIVIDRKIMAEIRALGARAA